MPLYCELPIWGNVFEPLNTISNLAFIVGAYYIWRLTRDVGEGKHHRQVLILAGILAAVGVGSGLWHFFREPWSLALDVIPIQLFLLTFLWFLLQQMIVPRWQRLLVMMVFVLTSVFGPVVIQVGAGYGAALAFALVVSFFLYKTNPVQARYFFVTLCIFAFSLTMRQLDLAYCEITGGHGLHIFWHIINAYVLYRFAKTLLIKD